MAELDFSLHNAQLEIFQDPARFKVVAAGRRFGKSYLSAVQLLIEGLKTENEFGYSLMDKECWYIAPTFQQAKDIMWNLIKRLGHDVIESTVENTATIRLINGRKIQLKGSDRPDTLRGVGISFVVLDEYAFMKPDVWEEIILPTLTDVKGKALFIGTPYGKNHFYDLWLEAYRDDSGDFSAFRFKSMDNPVLDPKEINRQKNRASSEAFKQEYEASFSTGSGKTFKKEWIEFDDYEPEDASYFIAVDPASYDAKSQMSKSRLKKLDETSIAVVKVGPQGWWVKEVDHGRWPIRKTAAKILLKARQYQPIAIGIEGGALKNAMSDYLHDEQRRLNIYPNIVSLSHKKQNKTDRITWALQGRMEHGRVKFAKGDWNDALVEQLLDFPNPLAHDDLVDSLAYIDQLATVTYGHSADMEEDWIDVLDDDIGF